MEVKHTPGPWTWVKPDKWPNHDDYEVGLGGFTSASGFICTFGHNAQYYPCEGNPPNEANARLIAAAPDLLLALKVLVGQADYFAYGVQEAMSAIDKAEGNA